MFIFQNKTGEYNFKTLIISQMPVFISYEEVVRLAMESDVDVKTLEKAMYNDSFPAPINMERSDAEIETCGIWIYRQVDHFLAAFAEKINRKSS